MSYLLILKDYAVLYINKEKLSEDVEAYLTSYNITIKAYEEIESDIMSCHNYNIWMSPTINFAIYNAAIRQNIVNLTNSPVCEFKSIKNKTEISGFHNAMIRDGIAMVRFLMWLDKSVKTATRQKQA